jgi:hypothetical protein
MLSLSYYLSESMNILIDRFGRLDIMFMRKHLEKLNVLLPFLIPYFKGSLDCVNHFFHVSPFDRLLVSEPLYLDSTVCVIIPLAGLAIEQLVFVWTGLRQADKDAFLFTTDAAILKTLQLGFIK